jgi:type IV pilus assembly PilN-like protein
VKRLEINLASRPFRNNSLYWAGFGSATAILAAVTAVNLWLFIGHGTTMRLHHQDLDTKQHKRESLSGDEHRLSVKLTKLDFNGLARQAEFANDAIRRRVFSWTELFNRLEEVVPPAVMMTSIRPEIQAEGISIVVEGSAKDQEALLQLEENLIKSPHFARIYPGSERREQRGQDLHFSLKCDYLPGGRPDAGRASPAAAPKHVPDVANQPGKEAPASAAAAAPVKEPASPPYPPGGNLTAAGSVPPPVTVPAPGPDRARTGPTGPAIPGASPAPESAAPPTAAAPRPRPSPAAAAPRPAGSRPLLRPGAFIGANTGPNSPRHQPFVPASPVAAAVDDPKANFVNAPLESVLDYLTKTRKMNFIFDGSFDFRRHVPANLSSTGEDGIGRWLGELLNSSVTREGEHTFRVTPFSGGESLQEPPVDEEPVPTDDDSGKDDSQTETPPPEKKP